MKAVLPHIKGRLLDLGCGSNSLGLFASCGFTLSSQRRFMLGFNRLYIFHLAETPHTAFGDQQKAS
jgi:hypothetical protein